MPFREDPRESAPPGQNTCREILPGRFPQWGAAGEVGRHGRLRPKAKRFEAPGTFRQARQMPARAICSRVHSYFWPIRTINTTRKAKVAYPTAKRLLFHCELPHVLRYTPLKAVGKP